MPVIKAKETFPKVIALWQPVGYSTYQIANTLASKYNTKVTHTGVLDPLAEGVVVFLLGEERFQKNEYSECKKTYEFEITFGISTDSYDAMGVIIDTNLDVTLPLDLQKTLDKFVGNYTQQVPLYSAVKYKGKKLFVHAKTGSVVQELPTKSGKIYSLDVIGTGSILPDELSKMMIENINKISAGKFRQSEAIQSWRKFENLGNLTCALPKIQLRAVISRGLYVRSLSQDICSQLNMRGFVSRLVRTENGHFNIQNATSLTAVFGENFDHSMLTSKYL